MEDDDDNQRVISVNHSQAWSNGYEHENNATIDQMDGKLGGASTQVFGRSRTNRHNRRFLF